MDLDPDPGEPTLNWYSSNWIWIWIHTLVSTFAFPFCSEKLMLNHPELRREIASLLPTPDLSDMEERLNFLKKNIYKVEIFYPSSVKGSMSTIIFYASTLQ